MKRDSHDQTLWGSILALFALLGAVFEVVVVLIILLACFIAACWLLWKFLKFCWWLATGLKGFWAESKRQFLDGYNQGRKEYADSRLRK